MGSFIERGVNDIDLVLMGKETRKGEKCVVDSV